MNHLAARVRAILTRPYRVALPKLHDRHNIVHVLHDRLHMAYFAGVYFEGHGVYAKVAGGLFVLTVASIFVSSEHSQ